MNNQINTISVQDLEIGYKKAQHFQPILPPFSFNIKEGELIAILGSNGIGKSTLLNALAHFSYYKGQLMYFNQTAESYSAFEKAQTLSFIGTHYQVQDFTSVYEVISKGRSIHTNWLGHLSKNDHLIVEKSAEQLNITHLLKREFNYLSDGEKQRVLIAMALAQQSKIILLDEPTAYLDYPNKYYTISLLKELCKKDNKTVLFSSHDIEVVLKYVDKIILLTPKKVQLIKKKELLKTDELLQLFNNDQFPQSFLKELTEQILNTPY